MYNAIVKLFAFWLFDWIEQLVDGLQHFLTLNVILAPLLLLFIEECGIPLPINGDIILAYTGYRLSSTPHAPAIWEAFLAAQIAALAGATVLFFLARRWGQMIILKLGKFIFLEEKHIRKAERLFARWGVLAIIFGRHIPGLRIPVTIFAATSKVKYPVFIVSTFVSTSVWILVWMIAGKSIGRAIHVELQRYVGLTTVVVVVLVIGFVLLHLIGIYRRRRQERTDSDTSGD